MRGFDPSLDAEIEALLGALPELAGGRATPSYILFKRIAATGRIGVIPAVLPLTLHRSETVAAGACRCIETLLRRLPPQWLPAFDEWIRPAITHDIVRRGAWWQLKTKAVTRFARFGDAGAAVIAVASCHGNGRVREAAVRVLGSSAPYPAVPFLLLRINDWVHSVRRTAMSSLERHLDADAFGVVLESLGLVERLRHVGRHDHAAVVDEIYGVLRKRQAAGAVAQATEASNVVVRRCAHRIRLDAGHDDPYTVLADALRDPDPTIRLQAVRDAARLSEDDLRRLLEIALRDRTARVRARALQLLSEGVEAVAAPPHRAALLDTSPGVREHARWFLDRRGREDFAGYYREAIPEQEGRALAAAVAGLGETGTSPDADAVRPFASHALPSVRAAALTALGRLDPYGAVSTLRRGLMDPAGRVSRAAMRALAATAGGGDLAQLWREAERHAAAHVRRNVLLLIGRSSKWESLPRLLEATADDDPVLATRALHLVRRWVAQFNRSFIDPSATQRDDLRDVFNRYRFRLTPTLRKQIAFVLQGMLER